MKLARETLRGATQHRAADILDLLTDRGPTKLSILCELTGLSAQAVRRSVSWLRAHDYAHVSGYTYPPYSEMILTAGPGTDAPFREVESVRSVELAKKRMRHYIPAPDPVLAAFFGLPERK